MVFWDVVKDQRRRIYKVLQKKKGADGEVYYAISTDGPLAESLEADYAEVEHAVRTFVRPMWLEREGQGFEGVVCITEPTIFDVFTYPLISGKPADLRTPYSAFITQSFARRVFGREDPIGKVLHLDYEWGVVGDFTVAGILADMPKTCGVRTTFD